MSYRDSMQINGENDLLYANNNIEYSPTKEPINSPNKRPTQFSTNTIPHILRGLIISN